MTIDRRTALLGSLALGVAARAAAQTPPPVAGPVMSTWPAPSETIDLWPGAAPGLPAIPFTEIANERSKDSSIHDRAVVGISRPRMAVFRPRQPNGASILITPGGSYHRVVIDHEGYEIAQWLVDRGFTAFVLFYRLPGDGWAAGPNVCLSDAQRAMRLIRHRAAKYAIDPARVCAMGFSAGGHLCADLAVRFDGGVYAPVDEADGLSARPMVAAPLYPVMSMSPPFAHETSRKNLIGLNASSALEQRHSPHCNVTSDTPPCFLLHAEDDDSVSVENTLLFRAALRAKSIPAETHIFAEGGHGFGIRRVRGKPAEAWPDLFLSWARTQGVLR